MSKLRVVLTTGVLGIGCFWIIFILTLSGIIGAFCWPYTINSWLVFFGKAPNVVWWQGFILGYVPYFGQISIPAAIFTWLLMLFLMG